MDIEDMEFEYDFNEMVESFLEEYEFEYHYDEDEDLYIVGVNFEDLGDVTNLIINGGGKIQIVGEVDYPIENDMVYSRVSDFVHRFNAMDCVVILFLDPDSNHFYFKKNVNVFDVFDPAMSFANSFFRINMEMDMFGKAFMGVLSGVLSDVEAIRLVEEAAERFNEELLEDTEQYMN